jgi:hypothetical protein
VESEGSLSENYISADFTVRSERMTAAELIEAVGVEPDERWTKGEPRNPKRPGSIHKASGICFRSGLPTPAPMVEHVDHLLSRLEPIGNRIGQLPRNFVSGIGQYELPEPWIHLDVLPIFREVEARLRFTPMQVRLLAEMGADFDVEYCWWMPEYDDKGNGTSGYGVSRSRYDVSLSILGERTMPDLPPETPIEKQLDWFLQTMEPAEIQKVESGKSPEDQNHLSVAISSWQDEYEDYVWLLPRHFEFLARIGASIEIVFAWDDEAWRRGQVLLG